MYVTRIRFKVSLSSNNLNMWIESIKILEVQCFVEGSGWSTSAYVSIIIFTKIYPFWRDVIMEPTIEKTSSIPLQFSFAFNFRVIISPDTLGYKWLPARMCCQSPGIGSICRRRGVWADWVLFNLWHGWLPYLPIVSAPGGEGRRPWCLHCFATCNLLVQLVRRDKLSLGIFGTEQMRKIYFGLVSFWLLLSYALGIQFLQRLLWIIIYLYIIIIINYYPFFQMPLK